MKNLTYKIEGSETQLLEITLEPNESIFSSNGNMVFMDSGIEMESKLGSANSSGIVSLVKATTNVLSGENAFVVNFTNRSMQKKKVGFAGDTIGKIVRIDLKEHNNKILCQKGSFLASDIKNSISISFTKRFSAGIFGGEGFILQKIEGNGEVFIHSGGYMKIIELKNEVINVDTTSLVAFSGNIDFDIKVQSLKNILFSGEGLTLTQLKGTGTVIIQTMPLSKLAKNISSKLPLRK